MQAEQNRSRGLISLLALILILVGFQQMKSCSEQIEKDTKASNRRIDESFDKMRQQFSNEKR